MYSDKLDGIVNKYNHTYHSIIKKKPADARSSTYIDLDKGNNEKDPKFKFDDYVRISKYKNIFAKRHVPNWSEKVIVITNTVPQSYVTSDLKGEEIVETFYKNELQKSKSKRKGDRLYLKCKGYDNSFNSWIDEKDIVL